MIRNVLQYLEMAEKNNPSKVAFADEFRTVTYQEMVNNAKKIGSFIAKKNIRNRPIAVYIERDVYSIEMFFGVVYSGNFYVPIDATMPKERVTLIFDTLKPAAILYNKDEKLEIEGYSCHAYNDVLNEEIDEALLNMIREKSLDVDPLYAIFTSGSTGVPKGVLVNHRSVIDLVEEFADVFKFSESDVFGNQAPFDFDVSVKDIYSTIKNAATMQVVPKRFFMLPAQLLSYLNERKITTAIWATSALRIVANFKALDTEVPGFLNKIMFSGEVMPVKVLNYWREYIPNAMYVNLYGPTEITCNCTYYIVDREFGDEDVLPIGQAFHNTEVFLLDENNKKVTGEAQGELCVKGTCLAAGYYNNPEKTREAFCQNPLNTAYPELIYRTGDIAKYNELGELVFVSRKDFQIKHMGHRIELGEIEVAVNALPFVKVACCLYDSENEKIVCFYQSEEACDKQIVKGLCDKLPKYMWPNRYVHFYDIPMNKNSKIDRVKLKKDYIDGSN